MKETVLRSEIAQYKSMNTTIWERCGAGLRGTSGGGAGEVKLLVSVEFGAHCERICVRWLSSLCSSLVVGIFSDNSYGIHL